MMEQEKEGADSFTLLHHDLNICTNPVSITSSSSMYSPEKFCFVLHILNGIRTILRGTFIEFRTGSFE